MLVIILLVSGHPSLFLNYNMPIEILQEIRDFVLIVLSRIEEYYIDLRRRLISWYNRYFGTVTVSNY